MDTNGKSKRYIFLVCNLIDEVIQPVLVPKLLLEYYLISMVARSVLVSLPATTKACPIPGTLLLRFKLAVTVAQHWQSGRSTAFIMMHLDKNVFEKIYRRYRCSRRSIYAKTLNEANTTGYRMVCTCHRHSPCAIPRCRQRQNTD